MIKVGITGSNGFIGWHLCRSLELDNNKYELIEFKRNWFNDIINLDTFVSQCDIIIHLAGLNRHSEESEIFITNVFGAFGVPFYNSVISTFCHQLVNNQTPKIDTDKTLNLIYINDLVKHIIELFESKSDNIFFINHTFNCKVSDILEILIKFKFNYFENGQIPDFKNQFEVDLFNTFRSYFNLNKHFPIKYKDNIDKRGNFVEIIKFGRGGQGAFSTTKKGVTRGNHFHTRKIERFSVIKGNALIKLRKIGTKEVFNFYLSGDEPAYVDMPIWYIHNIINIGSEDLYTIFWINELYDKTDTDTYNENV